MLIFGLALAVFAAGCQPRLGPRPDLPTAVAGLVSTDEGLVTPFARRFRGEVMAGPTSTPAPWATPLPPTPRAGTPRVMHMKEGNSDCLGCHLGQLRPLPDDHWKRTTNETCLGCHSFDYEAVLVAAAPIAHERTGREACLKCHLLAIERARPMPGEHSGRSVESCGSCHKPF